LRAIVFIIRAKEKSGGFVHLDKSAALFFYYSFSEFFMRLIATAISSGYTSAGLDGE